MTAMRTEYLQVKMTPDEKALLAELAEYEKRPMTQLLRWLVEERATAVKLRTKKEAAA